MEDKKWSNQVDTSHLIGKVINLRVGDMVVNFLDTVDLDVLAKELVDDFISSMKMVKFCENVIVNEYMFHAQLREEFLGDPNIARDKSLFAKETFTTSSGTRNVYELAYFSRDKQDILRLKMRSEALARLALMYNDLEKKYPEFQAMLVRIRDAPRDRPRTKWYLQMPSALIDGDVRYLTKNEYSEFRKEKWGSILRFLHANVEMDRSHVYDDEGNFVGRQPTKKNTKLQ